VLPGDRVDIILTYSLPGETVDADRDVRASETVMSNIRVLALDQRLNQTEPAEDGGPVSEAPPIARTATLQVTPKQAEMITLATTLGDLSLVLNSVLDGGETAEAEAAATAEGAPRGMTLDSDVTSLLAAGNGEAEPLATPLSDQIQRIQIVRGSSSGAIELNQETVPAPQAPASAEVVAAASELATEDGVPIE
jgi:pilus assembly protein CpaB